MAVEKVLKKRDIIHNDSLCNITLVSKLSYFSITMALSKH